VEESRNIRKAGRKFGHMISNDCKHSYLKGTFLISYNLLSPSKVAHDSQQITHRLRNPELNITHATFLGPTIQ
jgi:hypothetical protein